MTQFRVHSEAAHRLIQWKFGDDTGVSSETLAAIALGVRRKSSFFHGEDCPHDSGDFGRCYRLVMHVPEILDVFPEIAKKVPSFKGILENWDELCLLYEQRGTDQDAGRQFLLRLQELRSKTKE